MRYKRIRSIIMAGVLGMLNVLFAYSQPADSLGYYLELAARNNPQINADFSLYKASLEKVPQAGAYPDPELEIGFFLKPMEILSGKQIADSLGSVPGRRPATRRPRWPGWLTNNSVTVATTCITR